MLLFFKLCENKIINMANLKTVLSRLAKAAGIPETNEALVALLSNESLSTIEVEPVTENLLNAGLLSIDSAKNNATVADHFRATLFNGIDAKLSDTLKDLEFSDDEISEINKIPKTIAKLDAAKLKIKELYEKKGASKQSKEEASQMIAQLNTQIAELKAEIPKVAATEKLKYTSQLKERDLMQLLSAYKYANKDIPNEVNITTAKILLENKLKENKWDLNYDLENGQSPFRLMTEAKLDAYKDNQPVTLKALVDEVLATNKLLEVNKGPAAPAPNNGNHQGDNKDLSSINSLMDSEIAALTQS